MHNKTEFDDMNSLNSVYFNILVYESHKQSTLYPCL